MAPPWENWPPVYLLFSVNGITKDLDLLLTKRSLAKVWEQQICRPTFWSSAVYLYPPVLSTGSQGHQRLGVWQPVYGRMQMQIPLSLFEKSTINSPLQVSSSYVIWIKSTKNKHALFLVEDWICPNLFWTWCDLSCYYSLKPHQPTQNQTPVECEPWPLKSTEWHGHFLNSTCDIWLNNMWHETLRKISDMRHCHFLK